MRGGVTPTDEGGKGSGQQAEVGENSPFGVSGTSFLHHLDGLRHFFATKGFTTLSSATGIGLHPASISHFYANFRTKNDRSIILSGSPAQTRSKINPGGKIGANRRNPKTGMVRRGHQALYDITIGWWVGMFK